MNNLTHSRDSIVYVTSDWSGLKDVLLEKGATPKGMPAFFKPLEELNRRNVKVELIVLTSEFKQSDISSDYFSNTNITVLPWPSSKSLKAAYDIAYTVYKVCSIIRAVKPSFVYSLGPKGVTGTIAAKITNTPVGVRIFGINTYYEKYQAQGELKFALKSPLFYLMFKLRSNFILATNDGSPSDLLNQEIGRKDNVFKYWANGFDYSDVDLSTTAKTSRYLIYPSRISEKKQQLEAVKILEDLHRLGHQDVKLLFVGHLTDKNYWEKIERYVDTAGLSEHVQYLGTMDKASLFKYMHDAICVLSIQKVSNLSNVLLEALSCNSVILSYREPALCNFLEHEKSALLINKNDEAAHLISNLIEDAELQSDIRTKGKDALENYVDPWHVRVNRELDLLLEKR
ncbi:glycosyltransferase [Pseudoalteromonas sp. SMS1]|uniref:glycosyltransferase n=1 Tax=Pseudoalteromonas sp. SMS1 TaxID=2908894 RepID=UPI001F335406|nr:glycosyltransferase [Pseudoalteromonas sp. SMS1]MCF2857407.1 glycosyltransferase [Pseudoalteromonas sp. SMS1]